jgi:hypothetical protein
MVKILDMARALINGSALELRQLSMDALESPHELALVPMPTNVAATELAAAAGIVELLCDRAGVTTPSWVHSAPTLEVPMFVVKSAARMPRLRTLCETEGPVALRKRGFLAPPEFLTFA